MAQAAIFQRQRTRVRFKDPDMDFVFGWILGAGAITGLSPGELLSLSQSIHERDPASWRGAFTTHGDFLRARAEGGSGADYLAACFSYRAAIQYCDPTTADYPPLVMAMETAFTKWLSAMSIPITEISIAFENSALPGYWLKQDRPRATLIMIGGGDTYREDLWYFAGEPGWRRGYDVVMVDLPSQGALPGKGLTMREDMAAPIIAVIDWLEQQAPERAKDIAIYGVSGGGYFTAQAVAKDKRIKAWIASTPIIDIAQVFRTLPAWVFGLGAALAGLSDPAKRVTFRKYAWQFGVRTMEEAVRAAIARGPKVDVGEIDCPSLFLVGVAESPELQRQSDAAHAGLRARGVDCTLRIFTAEEGADAHCQVMNFPLAHRTIFDWLDQRFPTPRG